MCVCVVCLCGFSVSVWYVCVCMFVCVVCVCVCVVCVCVCMCALVSTRGGCVPSFYFYIFFDYSIFFFVYEILMIKKQIKQNKNNPEV